MRGGDPCWTCDEGSVVDAVWEMSRGERGGWKSGGSQMVGCARSNDWYACFNNSTYLCYVRSNVRCSETWWAWLHDRPGGQISRVMLRPAAKEMAAPQCKWEGWSIPVEQCNVASECIGFHFQAEKKWLRHVHDSFVWSFLISLNLDSFTFALAHDWWIEKISDINCNEEYHISIKLRFVFNRTWSWWASKIFDF